MQAFKLCGGLVSAKDKPDAAKMSARDVPRLVLLLLAINVKGEDPLHGGPVGSLTNLRCAHRHPFL
eukprot:6458361-Amphidinium_carterae.1